MVNVAKLALLSIALGGVVPAVGRAPAQESNPSISTRARQLAAAGQIDQAITALRQELQVHQSNLDARLTLGNIYADQGDRTAAEHEFQLALKTHPSSDRAGLALGTFYVNSGAFSAAEKVLSETVHAHPKLAEARIQLATAFAGDHRYHDAERTLAGLAAIPEDRIRYYRLAASIHSGLGDKRPAAHDMENALAAAPGDEQLQMLTALTEADAGEWNTAARRSTPLFTKAPTARLGLLLLQSQLNAHQDFNSTLQKLQQLAASENEAVEIALQSGFMLSQAEQHKQAAMEFQRALSIRGEDRNLTYSLARELYAAGEFDKALATVASLRERADSPEAEDLAADIEDQRGNFGAAIQNRRKAIDLGPTEDRYLSLGVAFLKDHGFQAAEETFQKSIETFPNSARGYVGLGVAEYMMEDYDKSAESFVRGVELDRDSDRTLNYLGSTQFETPTGPSQLAAQTICDRAKAQPKDPVSEKWCGALLFRKAYLAGDRSAAAPAIAHLRQATALQPKDPEANCVLGSALAWTQRSTEARNWMERCVRLRPDSAEEHYRLSLVYEDLHLKELAVQQSALAANLRARPEQRSSNPDDLPLELLSTPIPLSQPK